MPLKFKNFARSSFSASVTSGSTTFLLPATEGVRFPDISGDEYFYVTLFDAAETRYEVCKVTGKSGDSLTVVRGQDGSTAQAWNINDRIELKVVAAILPNQLLNTTSEPSFNSLQLNTSGGATNAIGKLTWNDTDGTADLMLKGGNVTLQIGQEQVLRAVNKSGTTLVNGSVVYVSGVQGQRPTVELANGNSETTSSNTIGVCTEQILNNEEGFVTINGLVRDLNTNAWAEGTPIYLSDTAAGQITSAKPIAPNHAVRLGWVVRQHAVNGSILVNVVNGFELDELHDVRIVSPVNGQILKYSSGNSRWENVVPDAIPTEVFAGTVIYYAKNTPPTGFLKANGTSLSTTTYADLFSVIGYTFGGSGGSFNLPDLRGEFIRGWDDSRGIDSGRVFGDLQLDQFKSHGHGAYQAATLYGFTTGGSSIYGGNNTTTFGGSTGGTETRPRNISLLACIKY